MLSKLANEHGDFPHNIRIPRLANTLFSPYFHLHFHVYGHSMYIIFVTVECHSTTSDFIVITYIRCIYTTIRQGGRCIIRSTQRSYRSHYLIPWTPFSGRRYLTCIFANGNVFFILIKFSLKFIIKCSIDKKLPLTQIMASRRIGTE